MSGPVVWADATGRRDVRDLARAHLEASDGDVFTQWGLELSPSPGVQVLLMVRFRKPVRTEFALAFGPGYLEILAEITIAGRVSMVTRAPKVKNDVIECRDGVTVEIDQPGLLEVLGRVQALNAVTGVLRALQPESPRHIGEMN